MGGSGLGPRRSEDSVQSPLTDPDPTHWTSGGDPFTRVEPRVSGRDYHPWMEEEFK